MFLRHTYTCQDPAVLSVIWRITVYCFGTRVHRNTTVEGHDPPVEDYRGKQLEDLTDACFSWLLTVRIVAKWWHLDEHSDIVHDTGMIMNEYMTLIHAKATTKCITSR